MRLFRLCGRGYPVLIAILTAESGKQEIKTPASLDFSEAEGVNAKATYHRRTFPALCATTQSQYGKSERAGNVWQTV